MVPTVWTPLESPLFAGFCFPLSPPPGSVSLVFKYAHLGSVSVMLQCYTVFSTYILTYRVQPHMDLPKLTKRVNISQLKKPERP